MRLEFNVLWFENQPEDISTTIAEIREYIEESGFQPGIDIQRDTSRLEELSEQQERFNEFDLVLVDWDLGEPTIQGDEVARRVRARFGFTDIIFYSGKAPADLRGMVHKLQIDGVYCMPRTQLVARLVEHLDEVVKRLSRLEAMRGIAVATVGRCDAELKGILKTMYEQLESDDQGKVISELDKLVAQGQENTAKKYQECEGFDARLNSRAVTSFHLHKLALALTKGREDCSTYRGVLGGYNQEVLDPRNLLGHALEHRGEHGWEVSHASGVITKDHFPSLRTNFLRHIKNLESLRIHVTGLGKQA
jgi:CheY-like chemotaxis protein